MTAVTVHTVIALAHECLYMTMTTVLTTYSTHECSYITFRDILLGIPLYRWCNQPFGLLGWQGNVVT
jgi:hypothetical protein